MVGSGVDEHEQRPFAPLPCDRAHGKVIVLRISSLKAAQICSVKETLDPGCVVKAPRTDESAIVGIHAEGAIAAATQRMRQPAIDMAGCDAGDRVCETTVGTHRQTG